MFKMMLNAADRVVDKLKLSLSEKDRQIHHLQEEVKHLKQVIVDARMTESRLVATMEEGNQKWNSICTRWRQRAEDAEFRVQQLENCASKHLYDSVREKLLTVSSKLSDAESKLRDVTHERDEMQKFIDTLPDGFRGAWSLYLMTKEGSDENQSK
jgi:chromosome segregation ATPase